MAIFRIYPTKDTSIANCDGIRSVSSSNVGAAEILNLYKTVENDTTASILIAFNTSTLPAVSGSSSLTLKLFDAQHGEDLPSAYSVDIIPIEQDWAEGRGHDMDYYTDSSAANWMSASAGVLWATTGAVPSGSVSSTFFFDTGHENLEADISGLSASFGYYISISTAGDDLYVKRFHSRQTHFPQKRPFIELRWSDWTGTLSTIDRFLVTGSGPWSGSYTDPWTTGSLYGTLVSLTSTLTDPTGALDFKMPGLKPVYSTSEVVRMRVDVRPKDWNVATVATASADAPVSALLNAYYRVVDELSDEELVPFGTGSLQHTRMSYDDNGNYFTFYMNSLPPGRVCRFDFMWQINAFSMIRYGSDLKFRTR